MFASTLLALLLGFPADAQVSPAIELPGLPPTTSWTQQWAVSVSTGRTFYDSLPHPDSATRDTLWQLSNRQSEFRVTHLGTPLVVGIAVHGIAYPAGSDVSAVGAGLVFGARHPLTAWLNVEFDATFGLQRPRYMVVYDVYPTGMSSVVQSGSLELFTRLGAGVALRVASWLDVPVRLNLHVEPAGEDHYLGAASVGVRCLLP